MKIVKKLKGMSVGKRVAALALAVATAVTAMSVDWNAFSVVDAVTSSGTLSLPADGVSQIVSKGQKFTQTITAPNTSGINEIQKLSRVEMMFGAEKGVKVNAELFVQMYENTFSPDDAKKVYEGNKTIHFTGADGGYVFAVYDAVSDEAKTLSKSIYLSKAEPLCVVVTVTSLTAVGDDEEEPEEASEPDADASDTSEESGTSEAPETSEASPSDDETDDANAGIDETEPEQTIDSEPSDNEGMDSDLIDNESFDETNEEGAGLDFGVKALFAPLTVEAAGTENFVQYGVSNDGDAMVYGFEDSVIALNVENASPESNITSISASIAKRPLNGVVEVGMVPGETADFACSFTPAFLRTPTVYVKDTSIAQVSGSTITAISEGTTEIVFDAYSVQKTVSLKVAAKEVAEEPAGEAVAEEPAEEAVAEEPAEEAVEEEPAIEEITEEAAAEDSIDETVTEEPAEEEVIYSAAVEPETETATNEVSNAAAIEESGIYAKLNPASAQYTGASHSVNVVFTDRDGNPVTIDDYTLYFSSGGTYTTTPPMEIGAYNVRIDVDNDNYAGSLVPENPPFYTITPIQLNAANVKFVGTDSNGTQHGYESGTMRFNYTGSDILPNQDNGFKVYYYSNDSYTELKYGEDYTFYYVDASTAGKKTVYIKGIGNYQSVTQTAIPYYYTILNSFSDAMITVRYGEKNGVEVLPGTNLSTAYGYNFYYGRKTDLYVTKVRVGDEELTEGQQYTATVDDTSVVGERSITITGSGDYAGESCTVKFTVEKEFINLAKLVVNTTPVYNGTAQNLTAADITVTIDRGRNSAQALTSGTDYTDITCTNNIKAGTDTATVKITGTGNYQGTLTANFSIAQFDLSNAVVVFTNADANGNQYYYTGSPIENTIEVYTDDTKAHLIDPENYSITPSGATDATESTSITITAKADGEGVQNVTGTKVANFAIIPVDKPTLTITGVGDEAISVFQKEDGSYDSEIDTSYQPTFTGKEIEPTPILKWGEKTLKKDTDYELTYPQDEEVYTNVTGSTKPTVVITGKNNFDGMEITLSYAIQPRELVESDVMDTFGVDEDGNLTVKFNSATVQAIITEADYDVTIKDSEGNEVLNVASAGEYTVLISGKNNFTGEVEREYAKGADMATLGMRYRCAVQDSSNIASKTQTFASGSEKSFDTLYMGGARPYIGIGKSGAVFTEICNNEDTNSKYSISYAAQSDGRIKVTISATAENGDYYGSISVYYREHPVDVAALSPLWCYRLFQVTDGGTISNQPEESEATNGSVYRYSFNGSTVDALSKFSFNPGGANGTAGYNAVSGGNVLVGTASSVSLTKGTDYQVSPASFSSASTSGEAIEDIAFLSNDTTASVFTAGSTEKRLVSKVIIEQAVLDVTNICLSDGTTLKAYLESKSDTYTGSAKSPLSGVQLYYGTTGVRLNATTDYEIEDAVSYTDASGVVGAEATLSSMIDAGAYTITFKEGNGGNYKVADNTAFTYTIAKAQLSDATLTVEEGADVFSYTGNEQTLSAIVPGSVTLTYGGNALAYETDYTVSEQKGTNPGEYTITLNGGGNNYTGEKTFLAYIQADLTDLALKNKQGGSATPVAIYAAKNNGEKYGYDISLSGSTYTANIDDNWVLTNGDTETVVALEKGTDFNVTYSLNGGAFTSVKPSSPGTVVIKASAASKKCTGELTYSTAFYGSLSDATVTGVTDQDYTGASTFNNMKNIQLRYNGTVIATGLYSASASNDTNACVATSAGDEESDPNVLFTANASNGYYKGEKRVFYSIRYNLGDADIEITKPDGTALLDSVDFTGTHTIKSIKVSCHGNELTAGEDYYFANNAAGTITSVDLPNAESGIALDDISVGNVTVYITSKGLDISFGRNSVSYVISGPTLDESNVTISEKTFEYDGSAQEYVYKGSGKEITVKNASGTELEPDVDYTVSYKNNVNAGTATVIIKGLRNYGGTIEKEFTISPRSITSDSNISIVIGTVTYNARNIKPAVNATVKYKGTTLTEGEDYEIVSIDLDDASKTKGWIAGSTGNVTIRGLKNFQDERVSDQSFTITQRDIASPEVSVEITSEDAIYDGKAKQIAENEIKVYITTEEGADPTELIRAENDNSSDEKADYYVEYSSGSEMVDAGSYKIFVYGINSYYGSQLGYYTINAKTIESSDSENEIANGYFDLTVTAGEGDTDNKHFAWTGQAVKPTITITDREREVTLTEGTDYDIVYNGTNVDATDSAVATITGKKNYTGTVLYTFAIGESISGKSTAVTSAIVDGQTFDTYDGAVKVPIVTVDGEAYSDDGHFDINWDADMTNAGYKDITVTGKNGYYGSAVVSGTTDATKSTYHAYQIKPASGALGNFVLEYCSGLTEAAATDDIPNILRYTNANGATVYYYGTYVDDTTPVKPTFNVYDTGVSTTVPIATAVTDGIQYVNVYRAGGSTKPASAYLPENGIVNISSNYESNSRSDSFYFVIMPNTSGMNVTYSSTVDYNEAAPAEVTFSTLNGKVTSSSGKELRENTDYTVSFSPDPAINAGYYTFTISGKGNYAGSPDMERDFVIRTTVTEDNIEITDQTETDADGNVVPVLRVTAGGNTLVKGVDYRLWDSTMPSTENGQTGEVIIEPLDTTIYKSESGLISKTFDGDDIVEVDIDIADATVTVADQTYTGEALTPSPAVTYAGKTLTEGVDYTTSYFENVDPGTASLTISGIGDYTGTKTVTFAITDGTSSGGDNTDSGSSSSDSGNGSGGTGSGGSSSGSSSSSTSGFPGSMVAALLSGTSSSTTATSTASSTTSDISGDEGSVTLKWKASSKYAGYSVYRSASKKGTYKRIATLSSSKTSYTNENLKSGKTYYYYIKPYKNVDGKRVYGKRSKIAKVTVK